MRFTQFGLVMPWKNTDSEQPGHDHDNDRPIDRRADKIPPAISESKLQSSVFAVESPSAIQYEQNNQPSHGTVLRSFSILGAIYSERNKLLVVSPMPVSDLRRLRILQQMCKMMQLGSLIYQPPISRVEVIFPTVSHALRVV